MITYLKIRLQVIEMFKQIFMMSCLIIMALGQSDGSQRTSDPSYNRGTIAQLPPIKQFPPLPDYPKNDPVYQVIKG